MAPPDTRAFAFGPFLLDPGGMRLLRNEVVVPVSLKALGILITLVTRDGRLVTREELLAEVWQGETVTDHNISVQVAALRHVLGTDPDYIETVPRRGYRFTAPITVLGPNAAADAALEAARTTRTRRLALAGAALVSLGMVYMAGAFEARDLPTPEPPSIRLADATGTGASCCHTSVTLNDGVIMRIGGVGGAGNFLMSASAAEYFPVQDRMFLVGPMLRQRERPTATVLADGRVLVTGGYGCDGFRVGAAGGGCPLGIRHPLDTAEIFDPALKRWTLLEGRMQGRRAAHTATLLNDGTVLIVGGFTGTDDWGTLVELFDPARAGTQPFRSLTPLSPALVTTDAAPRLTCRDCRGDVRKADHTATLLPDGSVLLAGGWRGPLANQAFDGALRYRPGDPGLTLASPTGRPYIGAAGASATLLSEGRVVFAGGSRDHSRPNDLDPPLATTTFYTPATDRQESGPSLSAGRVGHTTTLIHHDTLVIAGGMPCPVSYEDARTRGVQAYSATPCDALYSVDVLTVVPRPAIRTTTMAKGRAYHTASWLRAGGDRVIFLAGLTGSSSFTGLNEVVDFSAWVAPPR